MLENKNKIDLSWFRHARHSWIYTVKCHHGLLIHEVKIRQVPLAAVGEMPTSLLTT